MDKENKVWDFNKVREFTETSEFSVIFSKNREEYIKSVEKYFKKALSNKGLDLEIVDRTMKIKTTKYTKDPYILVKGKLLAELVAKGFDLESASVILKDENFSEVINITKLCSSKTFENRRSRITNPKILKALELITKTKIFPSLKAIAIIGPYRGVETISNLIYECFKKNKHPAFILQELIIKKNLAKEGAEGDWSRFIPDRKSKPERKSKKA